MRAISLAILISVTAVACTSASDEVDTTTTTAAESAVETVSVPPQLQDHELRTVSVGDRKLRLAIADSPSLRSTGLMGVTDLEDLDGMLFFWRHEASGGFWMKDTPIPLDIVWFDESGEFVGRDSMVPCIEEDCPKYHPGFGIDFRYAIEANHGDLDWVTESTRIVYTD